MTSAQTRVREHGYVPADPGLRARLRAGGWWGDHCLLDWWRLAVVASPDALAVADRSGLCLTYAAVDGQSSRFAAWLAGRGVRAGDVVAVQLPNWAEFLVVVIALAKVGAVVNPLSVKLRRSELAHALRTCGTRLAVMPAAVRDADFAPLAADLLDTVDGLANVVFVRGERPGVGTSLVEAVGASEPMPASAWVRSAADDVAAILFTSGSEADPKGVMLTHNNLIASEVSFAYGLRLGPEDRMFMPAPVGHATGFLHGVVMPVLTRGASILCDATDGAAMADVIARYGATCGMSVPTVIDILLCSCEHRNGRGLESMRFLCCGGSPVPRRLLERARDLGVRLYSVYGSTESAPHAMTTFHDSDERVLATDGRACPGTEIRVVDPVTRAPLPAGVEGEEASRGPAVFAGYYGRPDLTARVLDADGWYYSGDLAVIDADGYLRVTGRLKDIINRGGENISAAEVERLLMSHPAIRAAAVVPVPDDTFGQRVCAFLVARDDCGQLDVPALREYFLAAGVAKFKIPERVEYLEELPLTTSGKTAKGVLRKVAEQLPAAAVLVP